MIKISEVSLQLKIINPDRRDEMEIQVDEAELNPMNWFRYKNDEGGIIVAAKYAYDIKPYYRIGCLSFI